MMACPREVIWPNVGDPILLVDLEPAPQDVQVRCSLDEVPSLGGFLDKAVEAEEQEDVAAANVLLIQVALCDAGLAEHSSPLLPSMSVFPVPVRIEVQVGVQVDRIQPAHAAVGDAGNDAGDVDVAMLEVLERFVVRRGDGQREHGAVGEDGAGTASGAGIKALAADDQFSAFQGSLSGFQLCARVAPTYADIYSCSGFAECPSFRWKRPRGRSTAFGVPQNRCVPLGMVSPFPPETLRWQSSVGTIASAVMPAGVGCGCRPTGERLYESRRVLGE